MTKILIDISTIEKNKDYFPGGKNYAVRGPMRIDFTCNGPLPESFIEGENIVIDTVDTAGADGVLKAVRFTGHMIGDIDMQALQKEKCDLTLKFERELMEVTCLGEEEWFYKYEPTFVTCTSCMSSFDHEYLESDASGDDGENYSGKVCPVCGAWDCCEVEYETIADALKRKDKTIVEVPSYYEIEDQLKDLAEFQARVIEKSTGIKKEDLDRDSLQK